MNYWRMGVSVSGLLLLAAASPSECRAREITVRLGAAGSNAHLEIERVWEVDSEIWVVSSVEDTNPRISALSYLEASVEVEVDAGAVVKHFISGYWHRIEATRIESREALEAQMEEDGIEIDSVLYDRRMTVLMPDN